MEKRQLTPDLPTYKSGQAFLQIMDGVRESHYKSMRDGIYEHIGKPQTPFDWKDPEDWIPRLLTDDSRVLALRIWRDSSNLINPRHTFGPYYLCRIHQLTSVVNGCIRITKRGERFAAGDEAVLAEMDEYDGLLLVLAEVAATGPGRRREFERRYSEFCRAQTTYAADSSIISSLIYRLNNLLDRRLIEKSGHSYQITHMGLDYLGRRGSAGKRHGPNPAISRLARANNAAARRQLAEFLQSMDPYAFEHLIKLLLVAMGYENVEVVGGVGDKGVDVVADIALGISSVREVIQVKRQKGNIGRPVLDQLRGALHYHQAVRGTIVTTGGFTKGTMGAAFLPGAPPITLIDGDTLLNLLIEHDIGIRRREIRILEFDAESLSEFELRRGIRSGYFGRAGKRVETHYASHSHHRRQPRHRPRIDAPTPERRRAHLRTCRAPERADALNELAQEAPRARHLSPAIGRQRQGVDR